jgi:hypothetical protein
MPHPSAPSWQAFGCIATSLPCGCAGAGGAYPRRTGAHASSVTDRNGGVGDARPAGFAGRRRILPRPPAFVAVAAATHGAADLRLPTTALPAGRANGAVRPLCQRGRRPGGPDAPKQAVRQPLRPFFRDRLSIFGPARSPPCGGPHRPGRLPSLPPQRRSLGGGSAAKPPLRPLRGSLAQPLNRHARRARPQQAIDRWEDRNEA